MPNVCKIITEPSSGRRKRLSPNVRSVTNQDGNIIELEILAVSRGTPVDFESLYKPKIRREKLANTQLQDTNFPNEPYTKLNPSWVLEIVLIGLL